MVRATRFLLLTGMIGLPGLCAIVWAPAPAVAAQSPSGAPAVSMADPLPRALSDRPDDVTGPQFHLFYVAPKDAADRKLDTDGTLSGSVTLAESWLAGQTNGRALQMDTYGGQLDITYLRLSKTNAEIEAQPDVYPEIASQLDASGAAPASKRFLVYYDGGSPLVCGQASFDLPGHMAMIFLKGHPPGVESCDYMGFHRPGETPDYLEFAALHDSIHTLGIVPSCAPHVNANNPHVGDSPTDLMWTGDGLWQPSVLDVGRDDYYEAHIPGCTDLADSPFLNHPSPAPQVAVSAHPPHFSNEVRPQFAFATEHGSSFWCRIDQGEPERCSNPYRADVALSDGSHRFTVYVVDRIGQVSPTATYEWEVDTFKPEVTLAPDVGPAEGASTDQSSAKFFFLASEGIDPQYGAGFACSLDGARFAACERDTQLSGLTAGQHTLAVRMTDNAGNTGPAVKRSWTVTRPTSKPVGPSGSKPTGRGADPAILGPRALHSLTVAVGRPTPLPSVKVLCPPAGRSCPVTVTLTTIGRVRVGRHRPRRLTLALTRLRVRPGSRAAIAITLPRASLSALKRLRRVKVRITIVVRGRFGHLARKTYTTTLKAPRTRR